MFHNLLSSGRFFKQFFCLFVLFSSHQLHCLNTHIAECCFVSKVFPIQMFLLITNKLKKKNLKTNNKHEIFVIYVAALLQHKSIFKA